MKTPAPGLHGMLEALSAEGGLLPMLQELIDGTCRLLGADNGAVGLYDDSIGVMRVAAVHGRPAQLCGAEYARGSGVAGAVLAAEGPIRGRIQDFQARHLQDAGEHLVLATPIRWRGALVGWVEVVLADAAADRVRTMAGVLDQIVRHAALLLNHSEIYNRERHRTARFELIARIASIIGSDLDIDALLQRAADAIHEALGFPAVDIPVITPEDPRHLTIRIRGGSYKRAIRHTDHLHIDSGIMGAAVRERRPQLVNDIAADPRYVKPPNVTAPRAELVVPILLGHDVLGLINVESDHPFGALDVSSLEIIAEFLAVAMRNARLFAQVRDGDRLRERHRLIRELHDKTAATMSSIALLSENLAEVWRQSPDNGRARSQRLSQLAQAGVADMEMLVRELRG